MMGYTVGDIGEPMRTIADVLQTIENGDFYKDYDQSVSDLSVLRSAVALEARCAELEKERDDWMANYYGDTKAFERRAEKAETELATLRRGQAVKPLEWKYGLRDTDATIEQASVIGGLVQVRQYQGKIWLDGVDFSHIEHPTVESAKAAAQADYERRILSALAIKEQRHD